VRLLGSHLHFSCHALHVLLLKYLSVCAGIEAATVAWHELGWEPVGFSEIEKFPSNVLAHHYPDVPNYGDMNDFQRWPAADIDVLVGGTPCQSFSVAGLRKGMADPRGNLALIYLAIADKYRPRWLVWENVPGVLSSDGGRDFGSIIGGMVELGYGIAYRVLDAQYFGVPQRRRRVFVVGCLGDWRSAAQVLFEPESLLRNPPPSRSQKQGSADSIAKSIRGCSGGIDREDMHTLIPDVANPLTARMHKGINTTCDEGQTPIPVSFNWQNGGGYGEANEGLGIAEDQAGPESASQVQAVAYGIPGNWVGRKPENGGNAVEPMHDVSPNLTAIDRHAVAYAFKPGQGKDARSDGVSEHVTPTLSSDQGGNAVPAVAFSHKDHGADAGDVSPPLRAMGGVDSNDAGGGSAAVAFAQNQREEVTESETMNTLQTGGGKPGNGYPAIRQDMAVRRLTPLECERLQGFPDNYTNIPGASDSARYKALGNSMAVPVMHWIGKRIHDYEM